MRADRVVISVENFPSRLGGYSTSCGVRPTRRQSWETSKRPARQEQSVRIRCSACGNGVLWS